MIAALCFLAGFCAALAVLWLLDDQDHYEDWQ